MKNTRSLSLLLLLLITSNLSHAQVTFAAKSPQLTHAVGWDKCSGFGDCQKGTWIDNNNQINQTKTDLINSHESNFSWLQSATVVSGGKKYHVFFYQEVSGDYKYPLTKVDWTEYNMVVIQILSEDEYAQIKSGVSAKDGKDNVVNLQKDERTVIVSGQYDEAQVLSKIDEALKHTAREAGNSCFIVNSQNSKGVDVVRFRLPGNCLDSDLSDGYFEVPAAEFKKLLID